MVMLDARQMLESSGDTVIEKGEGIDRNALTNGAPLVALVNVLELHLTEAVVERVEASPGAMRIVSVLKSDTEREIEEAVGKVVLSTRCYTALVSANDSPELYRGGAVLHVGESTSPESQAFGGEFRYFYAPRIILDSMHRTRGESRGGDVANVVGLNYDGEKVVLVSAFDGVTSWDHVGQSDNKAAQMWPETLKEVGEEETLRHSGMKDLVLALNQRFIERARAESDDGLLGTLALARVTRTEANDRKVELACVGDAKATVVWIDANNVLHTETVASPINAMIDRITAGETHAARMTNDKHLLELAEVFRRTTYMDKFASGAGTVGVIGKPTLGEENIATHEVIVPANAKFFKVITHTDGVDLYAKLLDIPPWLCALLFERHIPSVVKNAGVRYGTAEDKGQLFPGAAPFGIAVVHAMYALLHPDAYPFEGELRDKWDDAAGASFGDELKVLFSYIRQNAKSIQPNVRVPSYTRRVAELVSWYRKLLEKGINKANQTGLVPRRGHRHRKRK